MAAVDKQPDFTVNTGGVVAIAHSTWESSHVRVREDGRVGWWGSRDDTVAAEDRTTLALSGGNTIGSVWLADQSTFSHTDVDTVRSIVDVADGSTFLITTSGDEDWELDGVAIEAYEAVDLGASRGEVHTLSGTNSDDGTTTTTRFIQRGDDSKVYVLSV